MTTTSARLQRSVCIVPRHSSHATIPSVTVVIPCFNYSVYLSAAVTSALNQKDVAVDVVIVDDASTDGSLEVAHALAKRDPRVQVLANSKNRGPVATFNRGLEAVRGQFLVRLDADDMLTPGSLQRSTDLALAFPSVGLVYGHPMHFREAVPARMRNNVRSWTVWPGREWLLGRCRSGKNVITSPEVLMRRWVAQAVGGQKELDHTHDMEMWFRIAAFSDVGHLEGPDQALHRDHPSSLSAREVTGMVDLLGRREAFRTLLSGPEAIGNADPLFEASRVALATEALDAACHAYDRGKADPELIDALIDFAETTYGPAPDLPEWAALQRRARLSPKLVSRHPWYVGQALKRRFKRQKQFRSWHEWGVYERE